jgi:hypothetical protein
VAGNKTGSHEIVGERDDGDRPRRLLDHTGREVATCRNNTYLALDEVGSQPGQLIALPSA